MVFKSSGLKKEIDALKNENTRLKLQHAALLAERDFWVEQGRQLQNQLQVTQRLYAGLFDQLGRGVVTEESIKENLALAAEELRQPVVGVEAVRALTAQIKGDTQGKYTAVNGADLGRLMETRYD